MQIFFQISTMVLFYQFLQFFNYFVGNEHNVMKVVAGLE